MAILAQSGTANPQTSTANPVDATVSAVLISTDLKPRTVQVSYTSLSACASVAGNTETETIPAASSFLSPAVLPISQQVRLTSAAARPCIVAVDVKVWVGVVGDPAALVAQTVASVGLL
jgi:hypothetical protein